MRVAVGEADVDADADGGPGEVAWITTGLRSGLQADAGLGEVGSERVASASRRHDLLFADSSLFTQSQWLNTPAAT
jgi:hypothetical protein